MSRLVKISDNKYEKVGTLTNEILYEENGRLTKQLEETEKCLKDMFHINIENDAELDKLKEQQKVFIKYLENMLDDENDIFSVVRVKDALQKYKEIIGGK